jgi:hypothetical protein
MPHNQAQWRAFVLSRKEAARPWADLVERHHRIRRLGWRWPSKSAVGNVIGPQIGVQEVCPACQRDEEGPKRRAV